jgi:hypothetical protein
LQFAKAGSAATMPQQERNKMADVKQDRKIPPALSGQWYVGPRGDEPSASSSCRVAVRFVAAPTRVLQLLRRLHLRLKKRQKKTLR